MGGATADSPGKPFNVIDTELTQGRLALPIRIGSINLGLRRNGTVMRSFT
jgi:hypothetical protein